MFLSCKTLHTILTLSATPIAFGTPLAAVSPESVVSMDSCEIFTRKITFSTLNMNKTKMEMLQSLYHFRSIRWKYEQKI